MSDDELAALLGENGLQRPKALAAPEQRAFPSAEIRAQWLATVAANFVTPNEANRAYYLAVLEFLWPEGHGIPGPHRTEDEVRAVIDAKRRSLKPGAKAYLDPFRRKREMQGEEGLVGIVHVGRVLQLVSLGIAPKRIPRTGLKSDLWQLVLDRDKHACTVCGRSGDEADLQQDHRVPRLRGGSSELENWQPLCGECNNHKSTMCRNCEQDCQRCPWAFPERNGLIRVSPDNIVTARSLAKDRGVDVHEMVNELLVVALAEQKSK